VTGGKVDGPVEFVARKHDRRPIARCVDDELVDQVAAALVEPGMRLVEEPQSRPSHDDRRQRRAAALSSRQVPNRHIMETRADPETVESSRHRRLINSRRTRPEAQVLLNTQIVVERRVVTEKTNRPANRSSIDRKVVTKHLSRSALDPQESGTDPKQGRLPCPVWPLHKHDLAGADLQIDASQGREPAEEGDEAAQRNDWHDEKLPSERRRSRSEGTRQGRWWTHD